jgi:hypothetical protein
MQSLSLKMGLDGKREAFRKIGGRTASLFSFLCKR